MKKNCKLLLLTAVLMVLFTACGKEILPDTYIEGQDYQYMQTGGFVNAATIQKGENGVYYAAAGNYIYYMDETSGTLLPLCNKADCLHDKETDSEKISSCNAYNRNPQLILCLNYYDGNLYYLENCFAGLYPCALYRISADGSQKELVYQWEEGVFIDKWMIHRGVLYYTDYVLTLVEDPDTGEEEMWQLYTFSELPLTGTFKKPSVLYSQKEDLPGYTVNGFGFPRAYGNYVYLNVYAFEDVDVEITEENRYEYQLYKEYVFNINTKEMTELTIEGIENYQQAQNSGMFWDDRVIFYVFDKREGYLTPADVYIADLDGSNVEIFMEDVPQGYILLTDGKYLYKTNDNMVSMGYEEGPKTYWVYDGNLELVDWYTISYDRLWARPVGDEDVQYVMMTTDEPGEFSILKWEKDNIGNYNGADNEPVEIKYNPGE